MKDDIKNLIFDLKRAERVKAFLEIGRTAIHNGLFEIERADDLTIRQAQDITERAIKEMSDKIFMIQQNLSEVLK